MNETTPLKILVIEDEIIISNDIKRSLKRLGYQVVGSAISGAGALKKAEEVKPDLVLMDIRIRGDMDGIETAALLRERFHLPVIYLTAFADASTLERARETGPFGYLLKPFEERELATAIEMAFYKHASERRLQKSEEKLAQVVETNADAIIILDATGKISSANAAAERISGLTKAEICERTHDDARWQITSLDGSALPPEAFPFARVAATGETVYGVECALCHATGRGVFVSVNAAPLKDENGRFDGSVFSLTDITERKQSEAALLRMHNELEMRVEERTAQLKQSNAALETQIAVRERAEAEIRTRARQQEAVAELGRKALSNIGMDVGALLKVATYLVRATLDVEISSILEWVPGTDKLHIRAGGDGARDFAGRLIEGGADSQSGYSLLSRTPTIVTDLPMETRFKPSAFLLGLGVVSSISVIVGGYEEPFGTLSAHTLQKRHFTQDDVNFLEAMSNVLAAAVERYKVETEVHQLNTQLKETNEQLRIDNIERQVTMASLRLAAKAHQEAREEADSANRAKSEFLSRMSHELRTPLNAILGFGQILEMRNQEADSQQQDNIQQILKGGRHLLGLINEVLDITRVETGGADLSLEPIAIDDVVPEACELVGSLAAQRGIRLDHNLGVAGKSHVLADRQRLQQVLLNLLSNAIKYNCPGGEVVVLCEERPDGRIRIGVRDTGPGIAAEDLPKLFTPFERLNSPVEGTGLGLVLSQQLVSAMGGTIHVESVPGQGSTFSVELALALAPETSGSNLAAVDSQTIKNESAQRQYSVLCIEDNPSNLRLFEVILESRPKVRLLPAMQGSVGLDLAHQHLPDLILIDLHLPDISGQEVLNRLQRSDSTRKIPVIVISADATTRQIQRLKEAGARAYLTKPLNVAQFLHLLDGILETAPPP